MGGRLIAVVSDKGGVGKTSCATSVAHGLALQGASVLLIDFDLLGQDAIVLGLSPAPGVYQHFVQQTPARRVIGESGRPGLQLLPGNGWTRRADHELRSVAMAVLVEQVRVLAETYDFVVIDTHPSGYLQELAVRVADTLLVPVRCEALAMDGLAATWQLVGEIGRPSQMILVPTLYDERLKGQRSNLGLLQAAYPGLVSTPIPQRAVVAEGQGEGLTVWERAGVLKGRQGELAKVRAAYGQLVTWLLASPAAVLFDEEGMGW